MSCTCREFTYTSADGLALFCREYVPPSSHGDVICLPGLTRNSRDFAVLARHLADRYRVLTPDLRGRGQSQWDPQSANYHPLTYYNDVIELLSAHVQHSAVIVGTSLGGILAMSLAATAAERVAGIVLNDIGPEVAPDGLARIRGYVGTSPPLDSWNDVVRQVQTHYMAALPTLDAESWNAYARASYRQRDDGSFVPDYDPAISDALRAVQTSSFDMWPVWAMVRQPVLAIRGEISDILSAVTLTRMSREMPSMEHIEVPARGHVPLLNEPGVAEHIDSFLSRVFR